LVAVGPAFAALAMALRLLDDDRTGPVWVPVVILVGSLAAIGAVLFERRSVTARNR
jgi:hypothetical protein